MNYSLAKIELEATRATYFKNILIVNHGSDDPKLFHAQPQTQTCPDRHNATSIIYPILHVLFWVTPTPCFVEEYLYLVISVFIFVLFRHAGILSAYGMALADVVSEHQHPFSGQYDKSKSTITITVGFPCLYLWYN